MFYNHFPDKESLLRELVDARLGQLQERIHASRQHAASIEDLFHGAYLGGLLEVRADPTFFAMMFRNEPVLRALYNDNIFGLMLRWCGCTSSSCGCCRSCRDRKS